VINDCQHCHFDAISDTTAKQKLKFREFIAIYKYPELLTYLPLFYMVNKASLEGQRMRKMYRKCVIDIN